METKPVNTTPSRRLLAVLAVSLSLNLLIIGGLGALALRWHLHPQEQAFRLLTRQYTRRLDHDDARIMRTTLAAHHEQIFSAWQAYRQSLKPLAAAFNETPRNEAHLQAAEQETRNRRIDLGTTVEDAVFDGAEKISPAGRNKLVNAPGAE
jgi:uncharacterized membrane protein